MSVAAFAVLSPLAAIAQETATTVAGTPAGDTIVTVPLGNWTTNVLDIAGAILMAAVASLVAIAARMLPDWLRPLVTTAVQAAIANFVRQGIAYAIQAIEGFDKNKTIDLNVGSAAVAVALRYVIEHAPGFLVGLAGGEEAIKDKIIALLGEVGITLDASTMPAAVKAQAAVMPDKV
ncbi:MAG: hypothetical protein BGO82_17295 [Devosia sp. 67-54]|nr:MAG: hypothetical protein BGO82_17295 [Devosia sp. 67-54]